LRELPSGAVSVSPPRRVLDALAPFDAAEIQQPELLGVVGPVPVGRRGSFLLNRSIT
jgi:hypothetical protein